MSICTCGCGEACYCAIERAQAARDFPRARAVKVGDRLRRMIALRSLRGTIERKLLES